MVNVLRLKSVEECALRLEPLSHISVALMAQYLNVRQRKLKVHKIEIFFVFDF